MFFENFVESMVKLLRSIEIEEEDIILLDHPHLLEKHLDELYASGVGLVTRSTMDPSLFSKVPYEHF